MKTLTNRRAFFSHSAITLAALASMPLLAVAQDEGRQPVPPPGGNVLVLKCCQCTGRELADVLINTGPTGAIGVAPWKLVSGPTFVLPGPPPSIPTAWASASGSTWIGPNPSAGSGATAGTYVYQLRIQVPKCHIPSTVTIKGKYWGDDEAVMTATGATLSATPAVGPPGPPGWGFLQNNFGNFSATLPQGFSGPVTLTVTVKNLGNSPTGLLVSGLVMQRCASDGANPVPIDLPPGKTE